MSKLSNPHHTHVNCKDTPKGFLRRLGYQKPAGIGSGGSSSMKSTSYYICDSCEILIKLKQEELD